MHASLVSREVIADSIELVARGNLFDAIVALVGCDKTIPARSWRWRGSTSRASCSTAARSPPGTFDGHDVTIQDVFEAIGAHAAGTLDECGSDELEDDACPGAGACGGQFTANTMATVWSSSASRRWAAPACPPSTQHKAAVAYAPASS